MPLLNVTITRFIDQHQPGFVECVLVDVRGRKWIFNEKIPIVSSEILDADSEYPRPGFIGCSIIRWQQNEGGRQSVVVNTEQPWHVESTDGNTVFEVFVEQIEDVLAAQTPS